jgi:hypothetical protein
VCRSELPEFFCARSQDCVSWFVNISEGKLARMNLFPHPLCIQETDSEFFLVNPDASYCMGVNTWVGCVPVKSLSPLFTDGQRAIRHPFPSEIQSRHAHDPFLGTIPAAGSARDRFGDCPPYVERLQSHLPQVSSRGRTRRAQQGKAAEPVVTGSKPRGDSDLAPQPKKIGSKGMACTAGQGGNWRLVHGLSVTVMFPNHANWANISSTRLHPFYNCAASPAR